MVWRPSIHLVFFPYFNTAHIFLTLIRCTAHTHILNVTHQGAKHVMWPAYISVWVLREQPCLEFDRK